MEKVKNPFQKFLNNIILGLCLILATFVITPVLTSVFEKVEAETYNYNFYVYGYDDYGTISECNAESDLYVYNNSKVCLVEYNNSTSADSRIKKSTHKRQDGVNPTSGKTYNITPFSDNSFYVVGFFSSSDFLPENAISFGSSITMSSKENIYVLLAKTDYEIDISIINYSKAYDENKTDSISWESNYVFNNTEETIKMGGSFVLRDVNNTWKSFTYEIYAKKEKNYDDKIKDFGSGEFVYCAYYLKGNLQLVRRYDLTDRIDTTDIISHYAEWENKKVAQEYKLYSICNNDTYDGTTVTFNIYDEEDLKRFAYEVNSGYMNTVLVKNKNTYIGKNYKAVLQYDITSYEGDPIGVNNENGAFKGSFNGNGKKIGQAIINTKKVTSKYYYTEHSKEDESEMGTHYFGLFGCVVGISGSEAEILNLTIQKIEKSDPNLAMAPSKSAYFGGLIGYGQYVNIDNINISNVKYGIATTHGDAVVPSYCSRINCMGTVAGFLDHCDVSNVSLSNGLIKFMMGTEKARFSFGCFGEVKYSTLETISITDQTIEHSFSKKDGAVWDNYYHSSFCLGGLSGRSDVCKVSNITIKGFKFNQMSQSFNGVAGYSKLVTFSPDYSFIGGCFGSVAYDVNATSIVLRDIDLSFGNVTVGGVGGLFGGSSLKVLSSNKLVFENIDISNISISAGISNRNTKFYLKMGGLAGGTSNGTISISNAKISGLKLSLPQVYVFSTTKNYKTFGAYIGGFIGYDAFNSTLSNCEVNIDNITTELSGRKNNVIIDLKITTFGWNLAKLTNCYSIISSINFSGCTSGDILSINSGSSTSSYQNYSIIEKIEPDISVSTSELAQTRGYNIFPNKITDTDSSTSSDSFVGTSSGYYYKNSDGDILESLTAKILNFTTNSTYIYGYNKNVQSYNGIATPFFLSSYDNYTHVVISLEGTKVVPNNVFGDDGIKCLDEEENDYVKNIIGTAVEEYDFTLPELTNTSGLKCVGYREKDNDDTFYQVGKSIRVGTGKKILKLIPIFNATINIPSTTPLTVLNDSDTSDSKLTFEHGGRSYELKQIETGLISGVNSDIYPYMYQLIDCSTDATTIPLEVLKNNIVIKDNKENEYSLIFAKNSIKSVRISLPYSSLSNPSDEINVEDIETGTIVYAHPYKEVIIKYGTGSNGNFIYDKSTSFNLIVGDLSGDNKVKITYYTNFLIPDISFNDVTYYRYSYKFYPSKDSDSELIANYEEADVVNYNNISPTDISGNYLYATYSTTGGVTINYWSSDGEEILSTETLKYVEKTETIKLGETYTYYTLENTTIKNYNDFFTNLRYDFIGWKLVAKIDEATTENLDYELYVFPGENISLSVPTSWKPNIPSNLCGKSVTIDLYPVFIKKGGENLNITKNTLTTSGDYYIIDEENDLILMSYLVNFGDSIYKSGNYKLTKNLDMSSYDNFLPIGYDSEHTFYGSFDGNGFTISGLKICGRNAISIFNITESDPLTLKSIAVKSKEYLGLFGYVTKNSSNPNSISNFNLIDFSVNLALAIENNSKTTNAGSVAGYVNGVTISGVVALGEFIYNGHRNGIDLSKTKYNVGGIVGQLSTGTIEQCATKISVGVTTETKVINETEYSYFIPSSNNNNGGILGYLEESGKLINCFNLRKISTSLYNDGSNKQYNPTDGLIGSVITSSDSSENLSIKNCYSQLQTVYTSILSNETELCSNVISQIISSQSSNFITNCGEYKDLWTSSSNINGGLPYLKNVGTIDATFLIDANKYCLTEGDITRLVDMGATFDSENNIYSYKFFFFILDTNTWDKVKTLKVSETAVFNYLDGYTFSGYKDSKIANTYYNETHYKNIFLNNNGEYLCEFEPKQVNIRYILCGYNVKEDVVMFGDKDGYSLVDINDILLEKLSSSLYESALGKYIYSYSIDAFLTPTKKNYYKVVDNKLVVDETNSAEILVDENLEENGKFIVNIYNSSYYIRANLKEVDYEINLCNDSQEIIKTFNKNYAETITEFEAQTKQGYNFEGYGYFNDENELISFVKYENNAFEQKTVDDFRKEKYYNSSEQISNSKQAIYLYPIFTGKTYKVYYFIENDEAFLLARACHSVDVTYGEYIVLPSSLEEINVSIPGNELAYFLDVTNYVEGDEIETQTRFNKGSEIYYNREGDLKLLARYLPPVKTVTISVNGSSLDFSYSVNSSVLIYDTEVGEYIWADQSGEVSLNDGESFSFNIFSGDVVYIKNVDYPYMTRVVKLTKNSEVILNLNSVSEIGSINNSVYTGYAKYLQNLRYNVLSSSSYKILEDTEIVIQTEKLNLTKTETELEKDSDGFYKINSAEDLFLFAKIAQDDNESNARLYNDINLTGYNFSILEFSGILDGQNHYINGFTAYNNEFIYLNKGTIKNLYFDSLSANIQLNTETFGLITKNRGLIENVNIVNSVVAINYQAYVNSVGILCGENNGTINKCFVQSQVEVSGSYSNYIALVCGTNYGTISNVSVYGSLNEYSTSILIQNGAMISAISKSGSKIENVLVNATKLSTSKKDAISNIASGKITNVVLYGATTSKNGTNIVYYKNFSDTNIDDNPNTDIFVLAKNLDNSYTHFFLKGVGINLYHITTKLSENTNNDGIISLVKSTGTSYDNDFYLSQYLSRAFNFNTDIINTKLIDFPFVVSRSGKQITNYFDINTTLNGEEKSLTNYSINYPKSTIASVDEINFIYSGKVITSTYSFELSSEFTSYEISQLKKAISIKINEIVQSIEVVQDEINTKIYNINLPKEVRFNDKIELEINMPSFAVIDKTYGVSVNGNTLINSVGKKQFTHSVNYIDNTYIKAESENLKGLNVKAYFERDSISLALDLNSNTILASELDNIWFNEYENGVLDSSKKRLSIYLENTESGYVIPSSLANIFNYENNGKHYTLTRFIDKNGTTFYNASGTTLNVANSITTIQESTLLQAVYEEVKYTISVSNLDKEAMFTNLNGYTLLNTSANNIFGFNASLQLPEVQMKEYGDEYNFIGYIIKDTEIFVYERNDETGLCGFKEGYEVLNDNYLNYSQEKVISLVPVFEEKEFSVKFMVEDDEQYPASFVDGTKEKILNLSLSNVQSGDFVIEVPSKSQHYFTGYKNEFGDVIEYKDGLLQYDSFEIFLRDSTFVAQFEIKNIKVRINFKDNDTNTVLQYDIINNNSLDDYEWRYFDNSIEITLPYSTKNVVLPEVNIKNKGIVFQSYMIGSDIYTSNYTFVNDETIVETKVAYKINFYTMNGNVNNYYKSLNIDSFGYFITATYGENVVLPSISQVEKTGCTLSGFKVEGIDYAPESIINISNTVDVEFIYQGNFIEVSLDGNGAVLPSNLLGNYISSYETNEDNTSATFKVLFETSITDILSDLPNLIKDGYMFKGYSFENASGITISQVVEKAFAKAEFEQISYKITIYEFNNSKWTTTKYIGEEITNDYVPSTYSNAIYKGLSLDANYYVPFTMPQTMVDLKEEYGSFAQQVSSMVTLDVFSFYISNITINILGNTNSRIDNTTGFLDSEFSGGNSFGNSVTINLSAEKVVNGFTLPIPLTKDDLNYASFVGYSTIIDEQKVLVVDNTGNLNDNFIYSSTIELTQEFEYNSYSLVLKVQEDFEVIEANGFERQGNNLVKEIKFDQEIGKLPQILVNNYDFKGFYISNNEEYFVKLEDTQISNKTGDNISGYTKLNAKNAENSLIFFNESTIINLVAKFEKDYAKVNIIVDKRLGTIDLRDNVGNQLTLTETETGYEIEIEKSTVIYLTSIVNSQRAVYEKTIIDGTESLNEGNIITVTKSIDISVIFNAIEFTIEYYLGEEKLSLEPSKYTYLSSEITLPVYEVTGYEFLGWYSEVNFINQKDSIEEGSVGNVTLFAKMASKILTVNIYSNLDDYTQSLLSKECEFNLPFGELSLETFEDYALVGVFTQKDKEGYLIDEQSLFIFDENLSLYAYFERKAENNLSGQGIKDSPYLIKSEQDLINFIDLVNTREEFNNSKVWYKLANNVETNQEINIFDFKANFDGDMKVIKIKNNLSSFPLLSSEGKVEKNLGLFNKNSGKILNLVLISSQTLNPSVNTKFGNISGQNSGVIENCIVYSVIAITTENEIEFNKIAGDGQVTNCSVIAKSEINSVVESIKEINSIHALTTISAPSLVDDKYVINSQEEFEYILSQNSIANEIVLQTNIDMKGKVISQIPNLTINGNGYIIDNLLVLDSDLFIQNLNLNKVAIENLVFANIDNNVDFVITDANLTSSYITLSINSANYLFNNLTATNAYFESNKETKLAQTATLTNIHTTNYDISALSGENLMDSSLADSSFITDNTIWFMDMLNIMSDKVLPRLIGVGNIAVNVEFDDTLLEVYVEDMQVDTLFVIRQARDIYFICDLINNEYHIEDILFNGLSVKDNSYMNLQILDRTLFTSNNNLLEILLVKNIYKVVVEVDTSGAGLISYNEQSKEKFEIEVESGQMIVLDIIANSGYRFEGWSDEITSQRRETIVKSDMTLVAKFSRLTKYSLITKNDANIQFQDLNERWQEISEGYEILITSEENIEDFLPTLTKVEHTFIAYNTYKVDDYEYKVVPQFETNYIKLDFDYDKSFVRVNLTSDSEFSINYSDIPVIKTEDEQICILKGYTVNLIIRSTGANITDIIINNSRLEIDYEALKATNEYSSDFDFVEDTLVKIDVSIIYKTVTFDYDDNDIESIVVDKETLSSKQKTLPQFSSVEFEVKPNISKEIDKVEVYSSENILLEELSSLDGKYSLILNDDIIIKILVKDIEFEVRVYSTAGGSFKTELTSEEFTSEYENSFLIKVKYNESIGLVISQDDNYKISSIKQIGATTQNLKTTNYVEILNIKSNLDVIIEFEKVDTWLDINSDNLPKYFVLQTLRGKGTESSPYLLTSMFDFLTIAYNVNYNSESYSGKYFKSISKDMTFNFTDHYFSPIGNTETSFDGIIMGENLTLSNVNIIGGENVGVFKVVGQNATIKSIKISGNIMGALNVGSICGINNGTLIGISNSANITVTNAFNSTNNNTGGICAINNGEIKRSTNLGDIDSSSNNVAGIVAVNNSKVENIYNTGLIISRTNNEDYVVSGLVAINTGTVSIGYNNSRVIAYIDSYTSSLTKIIGTSLGTCDNLYYNSNSLSTENGEGKTLAQLKNQQNAIYENWDFISIWKFENTNSLPTLKTVYEFSGSVTFNITFADDVPIEDSYLIVEFTNNLNQSYALMFTANNKSATLKNLPQGSYSLILTTLLGTSTNYATQEVEISEENGENIVINIGISKASVGGYYAKVVI